MKAKMVEVSRKSDKLFVVRVISQDKLLNIVSAYAPQERCRKNQKEEFWQELDELMQGI